jgi:hypothetical protein
MPSDSVFGISETISPPTSTHELEAYFGLIANHWQSTNPDGLDSGVYTSYTSDRYFSMERLSVMPFSLARVPLKQDSHFLISGNTTAKMSGIPQHNCTKVDGCSWLIIFLLQLCPYSPANVAMVAWHTSFCIRKQMIFSH